MKLCLHARDLHSAAKKCIIYTSKTTDPCQNLAFEDWMYSNVDFARHDCLFLWQNSPSVVIGRHQNPWRECRVGELRKNGVVLCRRNSGGGAVYHDAGNLNLTFFTDRRSYDRRRNLGLLADALKNFGVEINCRDDIVLRDGRKISGSAAKLGRTNAYHHCTLLVDSYASDIVRYLHQDNSHLKSTATDSVRSRVANLSDVDSSVSVAGVSQVVVDAYARANAHPAARYEIDPTDERLLKGVTLLADKQRDWGWVYGRTPKFSVDVSGLVQLVVHKGRIAEVTLENEVTRPDADALASAGKLLRGMRFMPCDIEDLSNTAFDGTALNTVVPRLCKAILSLM